MRKFLSLFICCYLIYTGTNSLNNGLVNQVQNQGPSQNNSKMYILFDNNMQGTLHPIYDTKSGQIRYIEKVNDSMIRMLSY